MQQKPTVWARGGTEYFIHHAPSTQAMDRCRSIQSRSQLKLPPKALRLGLHIGVIHCASVDYMEIAGKRTVRTGADSLAIAMLRTFDSLRKATPNNFKDTSAAGKQSAFQQAIAQFVFGGHPSTAAYLRLVPFGLDTAQVNRQILTLAAKSGLTLGEVVHQWNLAVDYPAARKALASLSVDTASLNPFQLDTPLHLDTLHLGEPAVAWMEASAAQLAQTQAPA